MKKILIFSLLFFWTITTNATLYLSKSDIKTWTDKWYILSANYWDYNTCDSTKNTNNKKYTSYKRSECFSTNNWYNYFICESSTDCSISWKTSSVNEMTINLDIPNKNALDKFLVKVKNLSADMTSTDYKNKLIFMSNKLNSLENSYSNNIQITKMLEYLITWINQIKIDYEKNNDINNFLNDIYSDTTIKTSTNSTINTTSTWSTGTISNTTSTCDFDECLSNGFYVIKSTNTKYSEWCNSEWLKTPENLCILKIKDMYIAPKNFTFLAMQQRNSTISSYDNSTTYYNTYKKSLVNDQRTTIIPTAKFYNNQNVVSTPSCRDALNNVDVKYGRFTSSWDPSKSNEFFAERDSVRNNAPACVALDNPSTTNTNTWLQLPSNPETCFDLLTLIIPEKKWENIKNIWWDWSKNICDNNSSDKTWICALQLNRSKLKLYTDKVYSDFWLFETKSTYLWDWNVSIWTPVYQQVMNYSANMIKDSNWNYTRPTTQWKLLYYDNPETKNWIYEICVWY